MLKKIMNQSFSVGILKLAYRLPKSCLSLDKIQKNKLLNSSTETLSGFGFSTCFISNDRDEMINLIIDSAKEVLADIDTNELDSIIFYSGIEYTEEYKKSNSVMDLFTYVSSEVLYKLNLKNIPNYTLSQKGCSGMFSSFELADKLLKQSSKKYILCLSADRLPTGHSREIIYNVMSDAASAVLIEKDGSNNKIISFNEKTNLAYWDTKELENEILAMYFPMAQRAINESLEKSNLTIDDITWFVPHNVSFRSWEILSKLLKIPIDKIWTKNISRVGHTVSSDHVINISDMKQSGLLKKNDKLLLFTFGFGAHWSTLITEY